MYRKIKNEIQSTSLNSVPDEVVVLDKTLNILAFF
jgi:hypothetical protein